MAKYKKMISLGFVLKDIGPNQMAYTCISNANKWLEDNYGIAPVIFFEEVAVPCIEPDFARYNIHSVSHYYGYLVYTDIDSFFSTKSISPSKKLFYIYDINTLFKDDRFGKILNDNNVIKIFRCSDYLKKIKSLGFKLNDNIVADFNIDDIMKAINNEETRNSK